MFKSDLRKRLEDSQNLADLLRRDNERLSDLLTQEQVNYRHAGDKLAEAEAEVARLKAALNTPEVDSFVSGVVLEAQHQRYRWGDGHDAVKDHQNWFWNLGYLAGKLLKAGLTGDVAKAKHHCISSAALLANWHAAISGHRPGEATMSPFEEPHAAEKAVYQEDEEQHGEQAYLLWEYRKNPHTPFTPCLQSPAWAVSHEYRRVSQDPDVPLDCSGDPDSCSDNDGRGCYCSIKAKQEVAG